MRVLTEEKMSGRTWKFFQYDSNGNLAYQTDAAEEEIEYRYDIVVNISEM